MGPKIIFFVKWPGLKNLLKNMIVLNFGQEPKNKMNKNVRIYIKKHRNIKIKIFTDLEKIELAFKFYLNLI